MSAETDLVDAYYQALEDFSEETRHNIQLQDRGLPYLARTLTHNFGQTVLSSNWGRCVTIAFLGLEAVSQSVYAFPVVNELDSVSGKSNNHQHTAKLIANTLDATYAGYWSGYLWKGDPWNRNRLSVLLQAPLQTDIRPSFLQAFHRTAALIPKNNTTNFYCTSSFTSPVMGQHPPNVRWSTPAQRNPVDSRY